MTNQHLKRLALTLPLYKPNKYLQTIKFKLWLRNIPMQTLKKKFWIQKN